MNSSRKSGRIGSMHILVVDDHAINREFLRAGLGRIAARVELAASGAEAIEKCRNEGFDVILLDLHMPQMDGLATANRIRDLDDAPCADAHMIALTADTRPEERTRLLNAGFDEFLNKPISIPDLVQAIESVIDPLKPRQNPGVYPIATTALVDSARALAAANQDPELARKLKHMLAVELERELPRLDEMICAGQFKPATALLHQWAGAAGYAGALRFSQSCRMLRQRLKDGMDSSPGSVYLAFLRTAHATRLALES